VNLGGGVVQEFGETQANEFLIRLDKTPVEIGALGDLVRKALAEQFGADKFEVRWIRFGAAFGARFGLLFSTGAVIALIHDVLVTVGALMLANYEFDLTVIAALLTIVGFSVNDTVVICDRIRENLRKIKRETLESIINTSINETLSRTILTTSTALMVLASLYFLGGEVIKPFAFSLLAGFISGVYSTIFIASPVILLWEGRIVRK
jgi:preprotein translocase subunit SecF